MAYKVFNFPAQQLPYKRKGDKWRKQCVDWGSDRTSGSYDAARGSVRHMSINYDLVNGRIDLADFVNVLEPDKFMSGAIPDDIQHYPIINPKLNLLVGEETKRVFDMRVVVTNPNAVSEIERNKADALKQKYIEFLQSSQGDQNQDMHRLDDINRYITYEWQDMREVRANALLQHYDKELNIPFILNSGFKDALTVGQEMYKLDIVSGEPTIERLNPRKVFVYRSGNSNKIEDADIIVLEDYWAVGRIYDVFYDALTQKDRDYIEDIAGDDAGYEKTEDAVMNEVFSTDFIGEDGVAVKGNPLDYHDKKVPDMLPFDSSGNIRVVRVFWKSRKKILKVKTYDEVTGDTVWNIFPEGHVIDEAKGEEAEELWVNEAWEGTKIGDKVYVNIRPMPVQFNRLSNPSRCHFGIIGSVYNLNEDRPFSLVDMMKPYNYLYDVIHDRLNKLIAKNWGNILELDLSMKPSGMDVDKWLYYAAKNNIIFKDSFNEGDRGAAMGKLAGALNNNTKGVIPMDMGQTINSYVQYLEYIKKEMSEVVGISPQREGAISSRETVGGVERATVQSAHITEWLFSIHNDVKRRVYEAFLEVAKAAMQGQSKKFSYLLSDNSLDLMTIDGDEFAECDYGLTVDCSNDAQTLKQNLETLAQAALQTQALSFSNIMKLYSSGSLAEKQRMIEKAENDMKAEAQQQQQMQQQMAQEQMKQQMQLAEKQQQFQLMLNKNDNNTRIKVAQIEAMTKYETTQQQDPEQFDRELAEKKRQFDERIGLDRQKLDFEREKSGQDNDLKRELADKQREAAAAQTAASARQTASQMASDNANAALDREQREREMRESMVMDSMKLAQQARKDNQKSE